MKKYALLLFIAAALAAASLFPVPENSARADTGPKPSVTVDFSGLSGKTYYVTLLSEKNSTGPHSSIEFAGENYHGEGGGHYAAFLKLAEYEDADGYYFLQYFQDCSQTHKFSWSYYPPYKFKILLYFPETDSFSVSREALERYAFDSYFTASAEGNAVLAEKSYDYTWESLSLAARIVITISAELGLALLFGFGAKKQLALIAAVNAATQILLNVVLNAVNFRMGQQAFVFYFVILEFAVFAAEAAVYSLSLNKLGAKPFPKWKPAVYALAANAASFLLGLGLALLIPGIF